MSSGHIITLLSLTFVIGAFFGALWVQDNLKEWRKEGFERGHMVQCPGKIGYYWECDK